MSAPTRLVFNADIRTQDASRRVADALAWRDGRIVAVGARADVERVAGTIGSRWDAGGRTLLPGFVDAHHHPCIVALYGSTCRLAPPAVTDIASLQRALAGAGGDGWLVATQWAEGLLAERRAPSRRELDDAVPDRPLFALHYSGHRALANSRALELAGIDRHTADPSGGSIGHGPDGVPSGLLVERGMSRVESLARASLVAKDADGWVKRLGEHHRALLANGVTRVVDATVPGDVLELYRAAAWRGVLSVPTIVMPVSTRGYLEAPWDTLDAPRLAGDANAVLRQGPLKLVFDGAPGCAMCLGWWQAASALVGALALSLRRGSLDPLRSSFAMEPTYGRQVRTGITIYRRDEARALVAAARERGFDVAIHAIGNEAVELALDAHAGGRQHGAFPPRIEHAMFLDRELVRRLAGEGVTVVTQPHFLSVPEVDVAPSIPGLANLPFRWLLDAKVPVAGSSDHPVVGFDPLDGVRAAVTRRTQSGRVIEAHQRIELDEALAMFTREAAAACGSLGECGTLEPNKRADLVLLDRALGGGDALERARVRATVLGGELVFGSLGG